LRVGWAAPAGLGARGCRYSFTVPEDAVARPLAIDPNVLYRRVEDELVLVKVSTNEIYALNTTGAMIWELISDGSNLDATVERLRDEYDEPEARLRSDVDAFIDELRSGGFLAP